MGRASESGSIPKWAGGGGAKKIIAGRTRKCPGPVGHGRFWRTRTHRLLSRFPGNLLRIAWGPGKVILVLRDWPIGWALASQAS